MKRYGNAFRAYGKRILAVILACLMITGIMPEKTAAASVNDAVLAAQKKVWNLMNNYADPNYFLGDRYFYRTGVMGTQEMTDAQYEELHQVALDVTKNCTSQYDKIKAITKFVANHVYYDYASFRNNKMTYFKPYEVYQYKRTTCSGYTGLTTVLLTSIGIPCMELYSYSHMFNAAYDSEEKRWISVDTTWCSQNTYENKENSGWETKEADLDWFDNTPEELAKDGWNHNVYWVEGLIDKKYNSAYYRLCTNHDSFHDLYTNWAKTDTWYLSIMGARSKNLKAVSGFDGLTVKEMRSEVRPYNKRIDQNLQTVDLSETNLSRLAAGAYKDCQALTSVVFPASLTSVDNFAFYDCKKLKKIDLSGTKVSSIGLYAFKGCDAAKTIVLPSTLKIIDEGAFACYTGSSKKVKTTVITSLSKKKLGLNDTEKKIWLGRNVILNNKVYTIKFMGNGAQRGTMPDLVCSIGKRVKLTSNQYKRDGYKFKGWSTKKKGKGKVFKNKAKVKNLAKKNKTIRLYAQWKRK